MNDTPTLIIEAPEDEPTLIDPRSRPVVEAYWNAPWVSLHGGRVAAAVMTVLLAGLLSLVAYQQWTLTRLLRDAISELRRVAPSVTRFNLDGSPDLARSFHSSNGPPFQQLPSAAAAEGQHPREATEREAAALAAANDFPGALRLYRMLAASFPAEVVFRDIVAILRHKLGCDRVDPPSTGECS